MTLKELYESMGVEYETVVARFCGDENMLGMFVRSFSEDPTFQKLTDAMEALDYTAIGDCVHALKGVSANLSFDKLQAACAETVLKVRQNEYSQIPESFQKVKAEYEDVVTKISQTKQ